MKFSQKTTESDSVRASNVLISGKKKYYEHCSFAVNVWLKSCVMSNFRDVNLCFIQFKAKTTL